MKGSITDIKDWVNEKKDWVKGKAAAANETIKSMKKSWDERCVCWPGAVALLKLQYALCYRAAKMAPANNSDT